MFHRVKSEAIEEEAQIVEDMTVSEDSDTAETSSVDASDEVSDEGEIVESSEEASSEKGGFSYQRQPQSRPAAGGYPGSSAPSYNPATTSYSAPAIRKDAPVAPQQAASASTSDRRLTIGSGITMSGEIESCDYLLVEGTVEAALKGANVLDIAESGTFYGTVEIDEATIAGRFEGDITVHGRLTISATGTVTGSIAYKELEIEAGAVIDGKLTPLSAVSKSSSMPAKAAPAKASKPKSKEESKSKAPANNEGGLFSKAAAE